VLSSEWKTGRVRENESGDSEDGEYDELPCVIGESKGPSACAFMVSESTANNFDDTNSTRTGKASHS